MAELVVQTLLLGLLAEKVGKAPLADQLRERFYEPLGLDRTGWEPREPYALGTNRGTPEPAIEKGGARASGGLWSTAGDLARWARHLMELEPLHRPFAHAGWDEAWGLGVACVRVEGRELWGHEGASVGYQFLLGKDDLFGISAGGDVRYHPGSTGLFGSDVVNRVFSAGAGNVSPRFLGMRLHTRFSTQLRALDRGRGRVQLGGTNGLRGYPAGQFVGENYYIVNGATVLVADAPSTNFVQVTGVVAEAHIHGADFAAWGDDLYIVSGPGQSAHRADPQIPVACLKQRVDLRGGQPLLLSPPVNPKIGPFRTRWQSERVVVRPVRARKRTVRLKHSIAQGLSVKQ